MIELHRKQAGLLHDETQPDRPCRMVLAGTASLVSC